jgi:hypothetical protein
VSVTVTVQVTEVPFGADVALQVIAVLVPRMTVNALEVPELVPCTESSPLYLALTVWLPVAVGLKATLQLPLLSVQVVGVKLPALLLDQVPTVPPGVVMVPVSVSETVAVQLMP